MTTFSKNFGVAMAPLSPPGYAYARVIIAWEFCVSSFCSHCKVTIFKIPASYRPLLD